MERVRRAAHAGSWYTNNASKLDEQLEGWLKATGLSKSPDVRGIIAPHAGYSYSGRCAAFAFANIDPANISRVFLLGPSHHYYTPKCALTRATVYKTPIGDLLVDLEVIEELRATGKFELMDLHVDEAEHSMEMHLPYLAKVFHGFSYTYYDKQQGPIYKSIETLDRMAMEIIETGDADAFKTYLQEYENTICGRHPISVFLHMLKNCSTKIKIGFVQYEQSSQCKSLKDSSVSYASAAAKVES
ncbi:protein MEMO1 isoform X2 [Ananas comosus]|uniref:Protein MEMO1 isoform X2 n=1 Tax=Ananas comosus TaxID=4615 RepID=A0A6P5GAD5_ANACO|nr:protein MEMO1 isoform X2 [Ananas comosus]